MGFQFLVQYIDYSSVYKKEMNPQYVSLLTTVVDLSAFDGPQVKLHSRRRMGCEGWRRTSISNAEEPAAMLKYLFDYVVNATVHDTCKGGPSKRFELWTDIIFKAYFSLFYPKLMKSVGYREEEDTYGFFHHCPRSLQRLVARWLSKGKLKTPYLQVWLETDIFRKVFLETIRHRFMYSDNELIQDALDTYLYLLTSVKGDTVMYPKERVRKCYEELVVVSLRKDEGICTKTKRH